MNWQKELTRVWTLIVGAALIMFVCLNLSAPDFVVYVLLIAFGLVHVFWLDRRFPEVRS